MNLDQQIEKLIDKGYSDKKIVKIISESEWSRQAKRDAPPRGDRSKPEKANGFIYLKQNPTISDDPERAKVAWDKVASKYGFTPEDFGKEFNWMATDWTITGITPRRRNSPLEAKNSFGAKVAMKASAAGGKDIVEY